jgi:HlyD family secretion protein
VAATLQAPTLFSIARDLREMQVDTNVSEGDVARISPGMPVSFVVDAYPQRAFNGRVRQVRDDAKTVQGVVTYDAVVDVTNEERLLKPGMTASVTFPYAQRDDVLRIPNAALRFRPDPATLNAMTSTPLPVPNAVGERVVWVLQGGLARPARVQVGISDGTWTEVAAAAGVSEADELVVEASLQGAGRLL